MESHSSEKIDISRIMIYAGQQSASRARVTSMEAANSVLQNWVHDCLHTEADECEVEIVFEDGLRYRSLYPLRTQEKTISLSRHVRRQLIAMTKASGAKTEDCAERSAANDDSVCTEEQQATERAREMLAHYNI